MEEILWSIEIFARTIVDRCSTIITVYPKKTEGAKKNFEIQFASVVELVSLVITFPAV